MQDKLGNGCKPTAQDGQRRPLSRVVAVEDDPDIRAVVDLALGHVGGLAVTCCDGGRPPVADVLRGEHAPAVLAPEEVR